MTKWKKGYKLIGPNRLSLCVGYKNSRRVLYTLMDEVHPLPGAGPLTVFASKASVLSFFQLFHWEYTATVVRCIYKPATDQKIGLWGAPATTEYVTQGNPFTELPEGTILADVVLCLE